MGLRTFQVVSHQLIRQAESLSHEERLNTLQDPRLEKLDRRHLCLLGLIIGQSPQDRRRSKQLNQPTCLNQLLVLVIPRDPQSNPLPSYTWALPQDIPSTPGFTSRKSQAHGGLDLTPRPEISDPHKPETPGSPRGSGMTRRPDGPNVQQPGTATSPPGLETTTTEQSRGSGVTTSQTRGPMIKVDGDMNPEQPGPNGVTPPNRGVLSTRTTTRTIEERLTTLIKEQERQNLTTTLGVATTSPTFATSDGVTHDKRSSTVGNELTNTTPPSPPSFTVPSASQPHPSFTLHTTVSVPVSTAPSRPVTNAPTSTTAPSKPNSIQPDIFIDSELQSTTEDDLKVVVDSFKTTLVPPSEGQVSNKRCSSSDRSMCHELAICEVATGSCRCKDGFIGDGYGNCT
ncbi:hypothetical protein COOONC_08792 [Cooperia oncophora]